jgi:hypothetical protein
MSPPLRRIACLLGVLGLAVLLAHIPQPAPVTAQAAKAEYKLELTSLPELGLGGAETLRILRTGVVDVTETRRRRAPARRDPRAARDLLRSSDREEGDPGLEADRGEAARPEGQRGAAGHRHRGLSRLGVLQQEAKPRFGRDFLQPGPAPTVATVSQLCGGGNCRRSVATPSFTSENGIG